MARLFRHGDGATGQTVRDKFANRYLGITVDKDIFAENLTQRGPLATVDTRPSL